MRLGWLALAALLAGCISPGGDMADDAPKQWQLILQAPVEIPTVYEEGQYQTVLSLEHELSSAQTVQVFGEVAIHTEHWQETKLWHRLVIDGEPRDLGELADGYGNYQDAGVEDGWSRKMGAWNDSWNEVVSLTPGEHVVEYQVKSRHTNQGDYASGSNPFAETGSLAVRFL